MIDPDHEALVEVPHPLVGREHHEDVEALEAVEQDVAEHQDALHSVPGEINIGQL